MLKRTVKTRSEESPNIDVSLLNSSQRKAYEVVGQEQLLMIKLML